MNQRDLSLSLQEASSQSAKVVLPLMALQAALFLLRHGIQIPPSAKLPLFGFFLLFGVFLHEALHVLTWALFGKKPLQSFRIGFDRNSLTPYAHCKEPMDIFAYRVGSLAPGLSLGVLPWAASLLTGNDLLFLFGWLYTAAAGGDFLILWTLRGVKPKTQVKDHPTRAGCYVMEE